MNRKIEDILRNFDQNQLREINSFLNSAQGQRLKNKLNNGPEREKLLREFSKLNQSDIQRSLSKLSDADLRRIISKL